MKLAFYIARRYLFAKKSRNIINVISMISMTVVAFVAAAMVCIMSAFSGIEHLVQDLFSSFDAPLTVTPKEGKMFPDSLLTDEQLAQVPGIVAWSRIIEEDAWLNYSGNNTVATIKGVDQRYADLAPFDSMMYFGRFLLEKDSAYYAVMGLGVKSELLLPYSDEEFAVLNIHAPQRGKKLARHREGAFREESIPVSGVFSANAELDIKYVFVPLSFARELFAMDSSISAVEIQLAEGQDPLVAKAALQSVVDPTLEVRTRFDKNALIYQTNASEKWATFLILLFILVIACFNIIASLTMLIIEKKKDIYVLGSLGADRPTIERIFILEGVFINLLGAVIGTTLGLVLCFLQQQYGLVTMTGAVVEYYPVRIEWLDVTGIFLSVVAVGSVFCLVLVRLLMKRFAWNTLA